MATQKRINKRTEEEKRPMNVREQAKKEARERMWNESESICKQLRCGRPSARKFAQWVVPAHEAAGVLGVAVNQLRRTALRHGIVPLGTLGVRRGVNWVVYNPADIVLIRSLERPVRRVEAGAGAGER